MKLEAVWCVIDPTPMSTIADICFGAAPDRFCDWAIGMAHRAGYNSRIASLTLWSTEAEARADAEARLLARNRRTI